MHIRINELLSSIRWSIGYIITIPIIVCFIIILIGLERIDEFELSHYQIAESTTTIVANEISKQINNQQRLLSIFAKNEEELIHRLSAKPDSEELKISLEEKIAESFPDYFAVSIADNKGIPIIDDFDDLVGDLCMEDLKRHAGGHTQPIRIHPNHMAYHIDIVVPWFHNEDTLHNESYKKRSGLLFVSFKPDFLFRLLALSSTPKHELMLINRNINNLIEITEKGARIQLKRDDFRLTSEEQKRRLYSMPVKNTVWDLSDFKEVSLFKNYRKNIIQFNLFIVFVFIAGSVFITTLMLLSEKRRVSAEKSKEEMFSLFNHDLRAPITSIYGFLDMYSSSSLCEKNPEKCKKFGRRALENAVTMLGIVDDILDLQKMESGEMTFDFTEVDIISLVKDTVEMNMQYSLLHNVTLKMVTEEEAVYINADGRRIKQALTNLLSNAIKYSPENESVLVKVSKTNAKVIISVSDKGPGIDKCFQDMVFKKFSQSKSKLTRSVGGTGLGLTIVKYITDAHNGIIEFKTNADSGTTFKLILSI